MNISWFNACLWLTTIQVAVGHPLPKSCWTWSLRKPWSMRHIIVDHSQYCSGSHSAFHNGIHWNWIAFSSAAKIHSDYHCCHYRCQSHSGFDNGLHCSSFLQFFNVLKPPSNITSYSQTLSRLQEVFAFIVSCLVTFGNSSHIQQSSLMARILKTCP